VRGIIHLSIVLAAAGHDLYNGVFLDLLEVNVNGDIYLIIDSNRWTD
jgi:hypothetical protein